MRRSNQIVPTVRDIHPSTRCRVRSATTVDKLTEAGSGTVLGIGLVAFAMSGVFALSTMITATVYSTQLQNVADSAALAAADARRGLVPGVPCQLAEKFVTLTGAELISCTASGDTMRVIVTGQISGFELRKVASAGAPL